MPNVWPDGPNANFDISTYNNDCTPSTTYDKPGFKWSDASYQYMANYSIPTTLPNQRVGANLNFFLILDHGAWSEICKVAVGPKYLQYEPWCGLNKMIADLNYAATGYNEGSNPTSGLQPGAYPYFAANPGPYTNYAKYGGYPIIAFFQNEGCNTTNYSCLANGSDLTQCTDSTPCYYGPNTQTQQCSESGTGTYPSCYQEMYDAVRAYLSQSTVFGTNNFYMVFNGNIGCPNHDPSYPWENHPDSDGCYAWVSAYDALGNLQNITNYTQEYAVKGNGSGTAQMTLRDFYYNAVNTICYGTTVQNCEGDNTHPILFMGAAYKGYDDYMSGGEYGPKVLTQGCGSTWLSTWNEMTYNPVTKGYGGPNALFSPSTNALPYMMIATWDDYEEGTEIETGIDNCLELSTFQLTVNNSQLTWNYSFNSTFDPMTLATLSTVSHYDLYYVSGDCTQAASCGPFTLLANNITNADAGCVQGVNPLFPDAVSCNGVTLTNYTFPKSGEYSLYIEAIGQPSITDWFSPLGQTYNAP